MRASDPRVHYERKLLQALLGIVIGVGLLPAGAVTHRVYLEAAGAVIVLLSLAWAVNPMTASSTAEKMIRPKPRPSA